MKWKKKQETLKAVGNGNEGDTMYRIESKYEGNITQTPCCQNEHRRGNMTRQYRSKKMGKGRSRSKEQSRLVTRPWFRQNGGMVTLDTVEVEWNDMRGWVGIRGRTFGGGQRVDEVDVRSEHGESKSLLMLLLSSLCVCFSFLFSLTSRHAGLKQVHLVLRDSCGPDKQYKHSSITLCPPPRPRLITHLQIPHHRRIDGQHRFASNMRTLW